MEFNESERTLPTLTQWRARIIDSILADGLKPAQRLPWQPHQIAADDLRAALRENLFA